MQLSRCYTRTHTHTEAGPALPRAHLCRLPALSRCRCGQTVAPGRSQAPLGSGAPTAAAGRAGLSPQRAEDRQGTCCCQRLPRVTEASEPRQDVRYHFIMTKATSHTIFKVHYYSPSTNHRHKPGIVQIWPKWQKTLSRVQGRGEPGRGGDGERGSGRCRGTSAAPDRPKPLRALGGCHGQQEGRTDSLACHSGRLGKAWRRAVPGRARLTGQTRHLSAFGDPTAGMGLRPGSPVVPKGAG